MITNLDRPISELAKSDLTKIKVVCFDGDGVTKKKGTEFINEGGVAKLRSFAPTEEMLLKLKRLEKFFHVTISSGRSLDYLKRMYGELVAEKGSLQGEIGMFLWFNGQEYQNFEMSEIQKQKLVQIKSELEKLSGSIIKGFEPKKYLITLHCQQAVSEVDKIVAEYDKEGELYCWWNEEDYDIGVKTINKGSGLKKLGEKLGVTMEEIMTVGNGINDTNMRDGVGLDISTDKNHLEADFVAWGEEKGGELVVDRLLELMENE